MLVLLILTTALARIIDYSHSDYIPILDGDVVVWGDYGYLRHTTNLSVYYEAANETIKVMDVFPQSHMKKILNSDIQHMTSLLSTLNIHHRHARSINFIGSALKVIAGTPDADDFENLRLNQKQLIDSNNRQIEINTKLQIKIETLTNAINTIIKNTKKEQIDTGNLFEILLARNRMILMDLQNLILSVALAKLNIVNPTILDQEDLKLLNDSEQYTNVSISDLISVSSIKVILSEEFLYFIIKYPRPQQLCKKITVFPVPHSGKILQLSITNTVADCGNQTYSVHSCQRTLSSSFCKIIRNSTCAQQLIYGTVAHCNTQYNNLEPVIEVDDGIIIINDATVNINESAHRERKINGTYLIAFENSITINGSLFVNKNNVQNRKPGTPTFPMINVTEHKNILSLPLLHEMNIENLRYIGELQKETKDRPVLVGGITFALFMACYLVVLTTGRLMKRRRQVRLKSAIESALKKTEDGLNLRGGAVNTVSSPTVSERC